MVNGEVTRHRSGSSVQGVTQTQEQEPANVITTTGSGGQNIM